MSTAPRTARAARPWSALQSLMLLTLAFLALAAASPARADPPGRVGRIAQTDGNVWLFDDETNEWTQARRNWPVTEGDRLSVEQGGRAEVQIGSATLRLDGRTDVELTQLNDARVDIRVLDGSAALRTRSQNVSREFSLVTNEGRYTPLRPGHYRVDVEERSSLGESLAGAMRFEAYDSVLDINDGQRAEFWRERGDVTHYAWSAPSSDRFGDWVVRDDRAETRERERYVSDEMTGGGDLDRYGRWERHPEYGAVWYPTAVVAGWAPYRYGHWAYVRPWGWTWVDDAPWGFAPFHYGRWVNYGGRWGWCPGQYVPRPVYAPALVAWFGGPNVSVGINVGGPAVGWVPLAPREVYYPYYQTTPTYVRIINSTHARWQGPNPRYEARPDRPVPTGPVMYTNQGVAGGVTVVPGGALQHRQPIGQKVVPVDARTVSTWQSVAQGVTHAAPPAPTRVTASPGGAVPAAPNATRPTPWSRDPSNGRRSSGGNDATPRVASPAVPAAPSRVTPPTVTATPPRPPRDVQPPSQREPRSDRYERVERPERVERVEPRERPGDRRAAPPVVQQPQVVQPPQRPATRGEDNPGRGRDMREQRDAGEQRGFERRGNGNGNGGDDDRARRGRDPRGDTQQVR